MASSLVHPFLIKQNKTTRTPPTTTPSTTAGVTSKHRGVKIKFLNVLKVHTSLLYDYGTSLAMVIMFIVFINVKVIIRVIVIHTV